jgi:hypothetical protein
MLLVLVLARVDVVAEAGRLLVLRDAHAEQRAVGGDGEQQADLSGIAIGSDGFEDQRAGLPALRARYAVDASSRPRAGLGGSCRRSCSRSLS